MKAHTPVMYTGSEQSWNGRREGKRMIIGGRGDPAKHLFINNVCI